ncbi:MAG: PEP-CTERM sorting domain-containing protein [Acidobacteriaceae bacterium]
MKKLVLVVLAAFLLCATGAFADTVYTLNCTDVNVCGGSGYGTVTLHDNGSGGVVVTVDLNDGVGFVDTGGPHTPFAFNLSGVSTISVSDVTSGFTLLSTSAGSLGGTPFGTFDFGFQCCSATGGANANYSDLSFTVNGVSISDFIANDLGYFFVADLIFQGNTGSIAANGSTPPVPEPTSMALLGTGMFGLAGAIRRKLRK